MNKKAKIKSSGATVSVASSTIPTFSAPPAIPVGAIPDGKVVDFLTGELVNDTPEEYVRQNIEKAFIRQYKYAAADCQPEFRINVACTYSCPRFPPEIGWHVPHSETGHVTGMEGRSWLSGTAGRGRSRTR